MLQLSKSKGDKNILIHCYPDFNILTAIWTNFQEILIKYNNYCLLYYSKNPRGKRPCWILKTPISHRTWLAGEYLRDGGTRVAFLKATNGFLRNNRLPIFPNTHSNIHGNFTGSERCDLVNIPAPPPCNSTTVTAVDLFIIKRNDSVWNLKKQSDKIATAFLFCCFLIVSRLRTTKSFIINYLGIQTHRHTRWRVMVPLKRS